ncbi:MAG: hypothetical protein ABEJ90_03695 [Halobacterium sp.]
MDVEKLRDGRGEGGDSDRVRNMLLAAVVFELAVVAGIAADVSGALENAVVVGLLVSVGLGVWAGLLFLYYLLTV